MGVLSKYYLKISCFYLVLVVEIILTWIYYKEMYSLVCIIVVPIIGLMFMPDIKEAVMKKNKDCFEDLGDIPMIACIVFYVSMVAILAVLHVAEVEFMKYLFQILVIPINVYAVLCTILTKKRSKDILLVDICNCEENDSSK